MSITVEEMIQNAVHFGHRTNKWNPRMKPYIYGQANGVHLFDMEKSKSHLEKVLDFVKKTIEEGKTILFVSTKPQTAISLPALAEIHKFPFVTQKWFGGLLTNFGTMKERIRYFKNLKEQQATGEFEKYPKKEQTKFEKEILKLEKALGGIQSMRRVPDVLFVIDGKRDLIAINEAKKLRIPVVGICDSNADPDLYDLFIPANDDAIKSLDYILGKVKEAMESAKPKPRAVAPGPLRQKQVYNKPAHPNTAKSAAPAKPATPNAPAAKSEAVVPEKKTEEKAPEAAKTEEPKAESTEKIA